MTSSVAHIVTSLGIGGTERQLLELLRGLPRGRWQPHVLCFRKTGAFLPDLRALGLDPKLIHLGNTLIGPHTIIILRRLARWLKEEKIALVHCHDIYGILVGVPAARLAGVPVIASRRDLGHHMTSRQRKVLGFCLRAADRVLCNAATVAAQVESEDGVKMGKLVVVQNGLDVGRFETLGKGSTQPPPPFLGQVTTVLNVGRMTYPAKGHDDLIEAAAAVHRVLPEVRFVLVGDGPREPALRAQAARLGLDGVVAFAGRRTDVPALLATADLVCHPARAEGLPNAVLEAMAAGRPVVATDAGGTPELLQDGRHGLLVPPARPDALAEAMIALLGDPVRARALGAAAKERIAEAFSVERLVEQVDRLYAEVARPPAGA